MARTWSDAGFSGPSLDDDRFGARARFEHGIGDIDLDVHGTRSMSGASIGGGRSRSDDAMNAADDMHRRPTDEPDAEQCYDEMVRYVAATTGLKANTSRVMPPMVEWETVMATGSFTLSEKLSLLSEANREVLESPKWRSFFMEVESVLRPILLETKLEPVYDHRVGRMLNDRGLSHADSKSFSVDDRVYTSNVFHMDDRFFVSIVVLESAGSARFGHIAAYFYVHSDRDDAKKKTDGGSGKSNESNTAQ